jgi:hypothetical protein
MIGKVDEAFEASTIKHHQADQIYRDIGRHDMYKQAIEYENEDDCYIYEIFQMNNTECYVNFGQISDIFGEEEWLQGEVNCLCNIASS